MTDTTETSELLAAGVAASRTGQWDDAKSSFQGVLNQVPDHSDAMWRLGMAKFMTGDTEPAIALIELSLSQNSENAEAHNALGFIYKTEDELPQAESHFRLAAAASPDDADILFNLGVVLLGRENFADAQRVLEEARERAPKDSDIHLNLGVAQRENKNDKEAEDSLRQAIKLDEDNGAASRELAILLRAQGRLSEAFSASSNAMANDEDNAATQLIHGMVVFDLEGWDRAVPIFENILKDAPDNLAALLYLGRSRVRLGAIDRAIQAFEKAVDLAPDHYEAQRRLRETCAMMRPSWLSAMLGDRKRNDAFQSVIERIVMPGDIVLDIGESTGSGLFSMMAARAGAKKVMTCEPRPSIAELTRRIIAKNGFTDQITIIPKPLKFMEMAEDLEEPATVIIADILDVTLVGGGVLPLLRHAANFLTKGDCKIIPAGATLWGQVLELPDERALVPIKDMNGFDVSDFEILRNPYAHWQFHPSDENHRLLSEPFVIADIDFADISNAPIQQRKTMTASASGAGHAVAVWFDLHLDADVTFSTTSSRSRNRWYQTAHMLPQELQLQAGRNFELLLGYNDEHLIIETA
ncbi:MAG: tetratricopeptide repeat protein [Rhodospirillaceae bacterium]|jgi:Tfp pilus assembly protein PilF|nr:tetratricopeptide repeat protein [Rhodospirillaceae bacterium]